MPGLRAACLLIVAAVVVGCDGRSTRAQGSLGSGLRVAWADRGDGALWVVRADGSERTQVDQLWWPDGHECRHTGCVPGAMGTPAWSPGAGRLAYWIYANRRGQVLDVTALNGKRDVATEHWSNGRVEHFFVMRTRPRALTSYRRRASSPGDVSNPPVWSPQGSQLAFSRADGNVEVFDLAARRSSVVHTRGLAKAIDLSFSPDGRRIALTDRWGGGAWLVDLRRGSVARFAPRGSRISELAWSPDGSRLVYARGDARGNGQLLVASLDGRTVTRLTNDVPRDRFAHFSNTSPVWSPDGSKVAFLSNRDGAHDEELFVIDATGRNERRLTRGVFVQPPLRWSPDSRRVAFLGWPDPYIGVATVGGRVQRLMQQPRDGSELARVDLAWVGRPRLRPALSPLRSAPVHRIVALRDHAPRGTERIVGVRRFRLLSDSPYYERLVSISPSGVLAAFVRIGGGPGFLLGVLDLRSGARRMLARGKVLSPFTVEDAVFSPDGRELLFRRGSRLLAVNLRTARVRRVIGAAAEGSYYWLRDDRIAYRDAEGRVVFGEAGGGRQVTRLRVSRDDMYAPSPDGSRLLYQVGSRVWLIDHRRRQRRLLGRGLSVQGSSWSPDGRQFALVRPGWQAGAGQWPDVVLYDASGRHSENLVGLREQQAQTFSLSWSIDSRRLLVTAEYGGSRPQPHRSYVYSAASGRVSRILVGAGDAMIGRAGQIIFTRGLTRTSGSARSARYAIRLLIGRLTAGR